MKLKVSRGLLIVVLIFYFINIRGFSEQNQLNELGVSNFAISSNMYRNENEYYYIDEDRRIMPYMSEGYFMCPLRKLAEVLGYTVTWDQDLSLVWLNKVDKYSGMNTYIGVDVNSKEVQVKQIFKTPQKSWIVSNEIEDVVVNKKITFETKFKLDILPQIVYGRTFIPVRSFLEEIDYNLDWNDSMKSISIYDIKMIDVITELEKTDENIYVNMGITWSGRLPIQVLLASNGIEGEVFNNEGVKVGGINNGGAGRNVASGWMILQNNKISNISRSIYWYDINENSGIPKDGKYYVKITFGSFSDVQGMQIQFDIINQELFAEPVHKSIKVN